MGQLPALSSPGIQAASCPLPMGPPMPAHQENAILASSGVHSLTPALPRPTGLLTHRSAAAGPWTPWGTPVESCSPAKPCASPRPPWGGGGVSLPSCGTEERGHERRSFGKMPQHRRAARGGRERRGLHSGAPRQLRAPALSRRRPAGHCGRGAAATLTVSQGEVTEGPTVTRHPGREGQGVPCEGMTDILRIPVQQP